MNGDLLELYHKMHNEFIELKSTYEERWNNHDTRSSEHRSILTALSVKMDDVKDTVTKFTEKTNWLQWSTRILWGVIIVYGVCKSGILGLVIK